MLKHHATSDVLLAYQNYCLMRANDLNFAGPFISPARQADILLSVLASTNEPDRPIPFGEHEFEVAADFLNDAVRANSDLSQPGSAAVSVQSEEWKRAVNIAVPMFMHYFNTGLFASSVQVADRVRAYVSAFDDVLESEGILRSEHALEIADWLNRRGDGCLRQWNEALDRLNELRDELSSKEGIEAASEYDFKSRYEELSIQVASAFRAFSVLERTELVELFGRDGEKFWSDYSIGRGDGAEIQYPTDRAIAATKPIFRVTPTHGIVPSVNALYTAILSVGETALERSSSRTRFLSHRDSQLEKSAAAEFRRLLPMAQIFESVYETPDAHKEHDVVVLTSDTVFIVEAKASPPTEPFRDPLRSHADPASVLSRCNSRELRSTRHRSDLVARQE